MKTIPELTLASNPGIVVKMREATVSDSIDFADVDAGMEEAVTSLFLDRIQDKATWTDPRKWTGEDRRLALYWYWMHVTNDFSPALTFECSVCGEEHTKLIDLRIIAEKYKSIQGKAERDIKIGEMSITVKPLDGESLEKIELLRLERDSVIQEKGSGSGKAKALSARVKLMEFLYSFEFAGEKDKEDPLKYREMKILEMGHTDFADLADKVQEALADMEHGLPSVEEDGQIYLLTEPVPCVKKEHEKEVGTQLRIPFRNSDYIPRI